MRSTIDMRDFDSRFKTALIFSVFEGLLAGKSYGVICDENPQTLVDYFKQARIVNVDLNYRQLEPSTWILSIYKRPLQEASCCGMCKAGGE